MKKLPKYLSAIALVIGIWGAFLVPNADAQYTLPILIQQPNNSTVGSSTFPASNIYRIGQGNLIGTISRIDLDTVTVVTGGTSALSVQISAYSDSLYSSNTGTCNAGLSLPVGTYNGIATLNTPSGTSGTGCVFDSFDYVTIQIDTAGGSNPDPNLKGIAASVSPFSLYGSDKLGVTPYIIISGNNQTLDPNLFPNNNPSGIATSTIDTYCDTNFGTSTTFVGEVGNAFAWAGCYVATFLFVPSNSALQGFSNLVQTSQEKIPFSYGYDIANIFTGLNASTTENMPVYSIGLSAIDFASSTAMGPIFPSNLDFLSSTTINKFLSPGMHDILYNFAIFVIWVEVAFVLYRKVVPTKAKI